METEYPIASRDATMGQGQGALLVGTNCNVQPVNIQSYAVPSISQNLLGSELKVCWQRTEYFPYQNWHRHNFLRVVIGNRTYVIPCPPPPAEPSVVVVVVVEVGVCVSMSVYTDVCFCVCMVCVCMYAHVCMYVCVCLSVCMHICVFVCVHMCACVCFIMRQVEIFSEEGIQLKNCFHRIGLSEVCGGIFLIDVGRPRPAWPVPCLGRQSWRV